MRGISLGLGLSKSKTGFPLPSFTGQDGLVIVGDSLTQRNNTMTAANDKSVSRADGWFYWATRDIPSIKTGIWFDATATGGAAPPYFRGFNFGLSGDALDDIDARTDPIINYAPKLAILCAGTNTGDDNSSFAQKKASLDSILAKFKAAGIYTILCTVPPRTVSETPTGSEISTSYRDTLLEFNDYILTLNSADVRVVDVVPLMVDTQYERGDTLYFNPATGMTEDGVHFTTLGAYTFAIPVREVLQKIYPNADQYTDAWFNADPTDANNIITVGELNGSSGTLQNSVTGACPTNWVARYTVSPSYASGVASVESNSDTGGQSAKFVLSCDGLGSATGTERFEFAPLGFVVNESLLTNGNYYRAFYKVRVRNNTDGILGSLSLRVLNNTQAVNDWAFEGTATTQQDEPYPTGDFDLWLVSQPRQFATSNVITPYLYADVLENISGSVDIYCDAAILLEVGDPATEFPYTP